MIHKYWILYAYCKHILYIYLVSWNVYSEINISYLTLLQNEAQMAECPAKCAEAMLGSVIVHYKCTSCTGMDWVSVSEFVSQTFSVTYDHILFSINMLADHQVRDNQVTPGLSAW